MHNVVGHTPEGCINKEVDTITVTNDIIFSQSAYKTDLERLMIGIVKAEVPMKIYMFGIYFISIIYTLLLESWTSFVFNILIICSQIVLNSKRLTNDQATYTVSVRQEKIKILLTLAVFTIRFFCFSTSKIVFIPTFTIFSISGNKLNGHSVFWGLFPTFYTLFLCEGYYVTCTIPEWFLNGLSDRFVMLLMEGYVVTGFMLILAHYIVSITSFLKEKIDILEDTQTKLEEAVSR